MRHATTSPLFSIWRRCALHAGASLALLAAGSDALAVPAGVAAAATPAPTPASAGATAQQAKKSVAALVNAIRFDKRALGEKHLGFGAMAQHLLGPSYQQMGSAERSQFIDDFRVLLVGTAFPKGHELFAYLDGILYGQARQDGERTLLPSTIVVHRNLKKTEMKVEWALVPENGELKVVDVVSMGESTCDGIRDDEVAPLVKEGGVQKLLSVLHERAESIRKGKKS